MEERAGNSSGKVVSMINQKSVIVTGVPRGGTTLLGSLINGLENSYCISEPMAVEEQLHLATTPEEFVQRTKDYFQDQRKQILSTGMAVNRISKDGQPVTNYFRRVGKQQIHHEYVEAEEKVKIKDENFILAVKHNAHFLSILPLLCQETGLAILSIIRHPIPTILSWRSLNLPISNGRLPSGEKFWPELYEVAHSDRNVLQKQVIIYELILVRLLKLRHRLHLLSYEKLVDDPSYVCRVFKQTFKNFAQLQSRNRSNDYNWEQIHEIREFLKINAPTTLKSYSLDDLDTPPNFDQTL